MRNMEGRVSLFNTNLIGAPDGDNRAKAESEH